MTVPANVIAIAEQFDGYHEVGENHTYFGSWYGLQDQWCAMFVSYCLYVAGIPEPASCSKGFCYNPTGASWFKAKNRFFSEPQVGDIAFIDYYKGTDQSDAWHVGIVTKVIDANTIETIEGNESDQVKHMHRTRSQWYGFGRPKYNGIPNTPIEQFAPKWPGRFLTLTSPFAKGKDIETWKTKMSTRGYKFSGPIDTYDKNTYDTALKFQGDKHLSLDGVVGPITWRAAWELPA
jgi:hypothetical protein